MAAVSRYVPPSPKRLIEHVLERPELVAVVRQLPPESLGALIDAVGLEGAGELVALATTEQLERVFDEDLWRSSRAGDDPHFDAKRFAVWLEVLLEAGESKVVERLLQLPLDFVTLAVHRAILVIDADALALQASGGGEAAEWVEKALESVLYEEWEEFMLIARDPSVWDALFSTLMALDREHHDILRRILERCCAMSTEFIDDNGGLYAVLSSDEMLELDVRTSRDERRAERGYVAPSDAKSFLELARRGLGDEASRDPVTRAYFRELARPEDARRPKHVASAASSTSTDRSPWRALFEKAGVILPSEQALAPSDAASMLLERTLVELSEREPGVYAERMEELAYLANVLVAGYAPLGRRMRPIEALEEAMRVCNAGLEQAVTEKLEPTDAEARAVVSATPLDVLFRRAFRDRNA
jgi:hypothetical protein